MKIDMEDGPFRIWAIDKLEEALLRQLFPNPEAEDEVGEGVSLWLADGIVVLRTRLNRNQ